VSDGWTRHGHRIEGVAQVGAPKSVVRCGGPGLCSQCSIDAAVAKNDASLLGDPGKPIVLTLKVFPDGTSECQYLGEPGYAVQQLRAVADQIEEEASGAIQRS
jgi:hypothetical protein